MAPLPRARSSLPRAWRPFPRRFRRSAPGAPHPEPAAAAAVPRRCPRPAAGAVRGVGEGAAPGAGLGGVPGRGRGLGAEPRGPRVSGGGDGSRDPISRREMLFRRPGRVT